MAEDQETSPKPGRTTYHHGQLKQELIKAGLAILREQGVHALSLREVARQAGVSHNAPYNHFFSKEALLAAIAEEGFNKLADATRALEAQFPDDPGSQLLESGWSYTRFGLEHPEQLRVMFGGLVADYTAYPSLREAANRSRERLTGIVIACQARGLVIPGDPILLTLALWSQMHGWAMLLSSGQVAPPPSETRSVDQVTRLLTSLLYEGLRVK